MGKQNKFLAKPPKPKQEELQSPKIWLVRGLVKFVQEQISPNHVQAIFSGSVEFAGKNPFDFDVQFSLTTLFVCMLDSSGLEEGWL